MTRPQRQTLKRQIKIKLEESIPISIKVVLVSKICGKETTLVANSDRV